MKPLPYPLHASGEIGAGPRLRLVRYVGSGAEGMDNDLLVVKFSELRDAEALGGLT